MRLLFIDKDDAKKRSEAFEKDRTISTEGAFTISTEGTAVRHRFADRPCAEFMSEIIRQAYQRAGLSVHEDFSEANGNDLIFSKTAAVQGLGRALQKAGWTIWDLAEYSPIEGAILMHQIGGTPGHTYMAASAGGLIVRDNGSPMGRDLSAASLRTLQMMFRGGVFFLPPGQTPKKWAPN